jgi:Ca-activated chloride channel family protein
MTDFQYPQFLDYRPWWLALAALHLLLFVQQWWWQRRQFTPRAAARFGPALSLGRGLLKTGLWAAAGWWLLTALAVPQGPPVKVEGTQSGADVVLLVDVSSSMLAQDIQPDRLTALKRSLNGLLDRLQGDRVGLIAFAGEAVIACPLTSDFDTLRLFLDKLDVESVPRDGTGLGPALQLALDAFGQDTGRGKLLVLATDGEDTAASKVIAQAERAKELGIPVFTLGIGTPGGALIPGRRDVFGRVFAKTYQGQPVRTKLDSATLKRIAGITGAEYSEAGDARGLSRAAERVRQLKQGLAQSQDRWVREPLYEKPLLWAFGLLLLESLLSARAGGWKRWGPALRRGFRRWWHPNAKPLSTALGLALLLPLSLHAAPRHDFNAGNQAYRAGDWQAAAEAYERSLTQGNERAQAAAHYNLGNARFQMQDYDGAIGAYEQALQLAPDDADAKHNLGLAQRRKQQSQQGEGQDGQKGKPQDGQKGQGQQGQGQGQGQGGPSGQAGQAQPGQAKQPGQGQPQAANALNADRAQAMMNQLRLDQKRYSGAFNPLKKHERPEQASNDPMQQMLEEMGMRPRQPQAQQGGGAETKDW